MLRKSANIKEDRDLSFEFFTGHDQRSFIIYCHPLATRKEDYVGTKELSRVVSALGYAHMPSQKIQFSSILTAPQVPMLDDPSQSQNSRLDCYAIPWGRPEIRTSVAILCAVAPELANIRGHWCWPCKNTPGAWRKSDRLGGIAWCRPNAAWGKWYQYVLWAAGLWRRTEWSSYIWKNLSS